MEIAFLKEYLVLAETLNFSKASKLLHLSQPTLSRHLLALEEEIGNTLIIRNKHNVELTEAGKIFYECAENIAAEYEYALEQIKLKKEGQNTKLRIGILYYQKDFLTDVVKEYKQAYPGDQIEYTAGTPGELMEGLKNNTLDICATMDVPLQGYQQFHYKTRYYEPIEIMVSKEHGLFGKKIISLQELKEEIFINVDNDFYRAYYELIGQQCLKYDFDLPKPRLVQSYEDLLMAVHMNEGNCFLTENMRNYIEQDQMVSVKENLFIARSVAWKKGNCNLALKRIVELLSLLYGNM